MEHDPSYAAAAPSARAVFDHAVELGPADARQAYLSEACAGDPGLRERVDALLRAYDAAGSFLDARVYDVGADATLVQPPAAGAAAAPREGPGSMVGPYKLLEPIGEGGMGTVYLAEQRHPVRRLVALKVIKAGMDTRQVVARFGDERQALALMDNPNIARVLDAGATDGGRPYFVMELVRGVPITRYCDEQKLTPRDRLALFVQVCRAVQHAHQKGIIHRDLKPSNVLVALYDGKPVPKVIDFGVAKATGGRLTEHTVFTAFGTVVGTPEYMSPEQAELNQLDVDTRSDVYSLGVILYELLTGSTPVERGRFEQAALLEMLRVVREEEAPRPSTRLSTTDRIASISASRGLEPKKLSGVVRGELDWIVMRCLEKDRARRYETASGLAADVGRYLADEAVLACPPSAAYRFRKFARRNRGGLVTAALALAAVLCVVGSAGWALRDRAVRRAAVAARVDRALGESEALYRERKLPEAIRLARRALDLGPGDPAAERRARQWVKDLDAVASLEEIHPRGDPTRGDKVAEYRRAFREYGIDVERLTPEVAAARIAERPIRVDLALALDKWTLHLRGDQGPDAAAHAALRARLGHVARLADPDPLRNRLRDHFADAGRATVRHADVRDIVASIDLATTPVTTLMLIGDVQDVPEMAAFYRRVQRHHPDDFGVTFGLGRILRITKELDDACRFLTAAVSIRPQSTTARQELGAALLAKGAVDDAIAECREATRLAPGVAGNHLLLGRALLQKLGGAAEAEAVLREAVRLGPESVVALTDLGDGLFRGGKYGDAAAAYRETIRLKPDYGGGYSNLGTALFALGRVDEAIAAGREAIRLEPNYAEAHWHLATALDHKGLAAEAIAAYREAARLAPDDGVVLATLGQALERAGRAEDAAVAYAESARVRPGDHATHYRLGGVLATRGRWDAAAAAFGRAAELKPRDVHSQYRYATLCALRRDVEGHRRASRALLDRAAGTRDILLADSTSKACALAPDLAGEAARVATLAGLKLSGSEPAGAVQWFDVTRGLCEYRAGHFDAAVAAITRSAPSAEGVHRDALAFSILALAQHRAGRTVEARAALANARQIIEAKTPDPGKGRPFGPDWYDWLHAQILYREAATLIAG